MRPKTQSSMDEFLKAMQAKSVTKDGPAGMSVTQMASKLGITRNGAYRQLRVMVDTGKARFNGKRYEVDMIGKMQPVPVYVLTKNKLPSTTT